MQRDENPFKARDQRVLHCVKKINRMEVEALDNDFQMLCDLATSAQELLLWNRKVYWAGVDPDSGLDIAAEKHRILECVLDYTQQIEYMSRVGNHYQAEIDELTALTDAYAQLLMSIFEPEEPEDAEEEESESEP